jgi:hypothetical protein
MRSDKLLLLKQLFGEDIANGLVEGLEAKSSELETSVAYKAINNVVPMTPNITVVKPKGSRSKRKAETRSPAELQRVRQISEHLADLLVNILEASYLSPAQKERAVREATREHLAALEAPPNPAQVHVDYLFNNGGRLW